MKFKAYFLFLIFLTFSPCLSDQWDLPSGSPLSRSEKIFVYDDEAWHKIGVASLTARSDDEIMDSAGEYKFFIEFCTANHAYQSMQPFVLTSNSCCSCCSCNVQIV